MDWFDLLAVRGTLKSLLQHHSTEVSILWHSSFLLIDIWWFAVFCCGAAALDTYEQVSLHTWAVYVYIKFLEMKLVIQRAYVFLILIHTFKLLYTEIIPFHMPSSNVGEYCFLTALPTQKYNFWIFGILMHKAQLLLFSKSCLTLLWPHGL